MTLYGACVLEQDSPYLLLSTQEYKWVPVWVEMVDSHCSTEYGITELYTPQAAKNV